MNEYHLFLSKKSLNILEKFTNILWVTNFLNQNGLKNNDI